MVITYKNVGQETTTYEGITRVVHEPGGIDIYRGEELVREFRTAAMGTMIIQD